VLTTLRKAEYTELAILFFIQGAAMSIWFVPIGSILDSHGLGQIKPLAFGASALAYFVSPLIFGAMADRHVPPAKVLRTLATATAILMAVTSTAIREHLNQWLILGLIQIFWLFYAPMFSISAAIVLARLKDAKSEFGPIRAMATLGWMAGCLLVSWINADNSSRAGYVGAAVWLLVALFTYFLPSLEMPPSAENLKWHERLGLDALTLLKNRDHRVIFIITTLLSIPIAAFYPYAPTHMRDIGLTHTSAWMSLAQCSEMIAMFSLGWLLAHWRLKWIFACGLAFGVLRFGLSAVGSEGWLLAGVALHGACFTLVYITAQIYLDQRVDPGWRTRAQALLSLTNSGLGNLFGYLGTGWFYRKCTGDAGTNWTVYWGAMSAIALGVLIYFLRAYHGIAKPPGAKAPAS
jgi:MFS family permease